MKAGDRVALHLQNSPTLLALIFGSWRIGVVPVCLNVMYKAAEVLAVLESTKPVLLCTDDKELRAKTSRSVGLGAIASGDAFTESPLEQMDSSPLDLDSEAEAVILFTGGSTGAPKAVSITHGGFLNSVSVQATASKGGKPGPYPPSRPGTPPNIVAVPLFHMLGQKQVLFAFHVGRAVLLLERFQSEVFLREAKKYGVDNFVLLPTMVFDMANHAGPLDLSGVKHVLVGGQQLSTEVRRRFEQRFHVPVLSIYGSTETGSIAGWTASDVREGKWKPGSVGRVFPGVLLRIVDDADADCPSGESGEIWVKATIAKGYLDGDNGSLLKPDGWVATGDMGYQDGDGVLFLNGRRREIIKCGGFQVFPTELEEVLRQHPWVADVAVAGLPDARLGQVPTAFVVTSPDAPPDAGELARGLVQYTRENLASFKAIRGVHVVRELPRNEVGKVERHRLVAGLLGTTPGGSQG